MAKPDGTALLRYIYMSSRFVHKAGYGSELAGKVLADQCPMREYSRAAAKGTSDYSY